MPISSANSAASPTKKRCRRPAKPCVVCGRAQSKGSTTGACSWCCSTLARIMQRGFRTDLGKLLWAMMAAAVAVPNARIASLVNVPVATVDA